jgi:GNAT superfamily N-acetyltransferase
VDGRADRGQTWPVIRERSAEEVAECVAVLWRVHLHDGYPLAWPDDAAGWLTPTSMRQAWVAAVDGKIVGHAMVRERRGVFTFNRLFVAPEGRGLGAAKALLAKASEWAKEQGVDRLTLDVAHTATAAIALYEQNGWRRTHSAPADWADDITVHYYELG